MGGGVLSKTRLFFDGFSRLFTKKPLQIKQVEKEKIPQDLELEKLQSLLASTASHQRILAGLLLMLKLVLYASFIFSLVEYFFDFASGLTAGGLGAVLSLVCGWKASQYIENKRMYFFWKYLPFLLLFVSPSVAIVSGGIELPWLTMLVFGFHFILPLTLVYCLEFFLYRSRTKLLRFTSSRNEFA